MMWFSERTW